MKKVLAILLALTMMIGLIACSSGTTPQSESSESSAVEESDSSSEETPSESETEGAMYDQEILWNINSLSDVIMDDFNVWIEELKGKIKEETGVTLNTEIIAWADYLNKHLTSIASGTGADIIQMGSTAYPTVMSTGGLVPLDDYMDQFGGVEAFYDSAMFYCYWDDQIYGLPWGGGGRSYYLRTDLYEQAGMELPGQDWTWDEYVEDCEQLTEKLGFPSTSIVGAGTDAAHYFWYTLEADDGNFLNDDYTDVLFNDETGLYTMNKICDLYRSGVMAPTFAEYTMNEILAAFINGEIVIGTGSDSWMIDLAQTDVKDSYLVLPPPRGQNGKFTNLLIPSVLGVTNYTENPDATVAALSIILSEEEVTTYNKFSGWLPFRVDSLEDPYFTEDENRAAFRYSIQEGTTFFPQHEACSTMRDSMTKYLQIIYTELVSKGDVSDEYIQEQLDICAEEIKAML